MDLVRIFERAGGRTGVATPAAGRESGQSHLCRSGDRSRSWGRLRNFLGRGCSLIWIRKSWASWIREASRTASASRKGCRSTSRCRTSGMI